jgi:hypothetical protein
MRIRQLLVHLLDHRAVEHLLRPLVVDKEERQVEHVELAHAQRTEFRDRRRQELHRAELQGLELLLVLVQRGVRVDLDLHLAVRVLLRKFLELERGLALGRIRRHDVAEFDDDRLLLGMADPGGQKQRGRSRGKKPIAHGRLSLCSGCCKAVPWHQSRRAASPLKGPKMRRPLLIAR